MKLWKVQVIGNVYVVAPNQREAEAFAEMEPDVLFDAKLSARASAARRADVSKGELSTFPLRTDADADEMRVSDWLTQMEQEEADARAQAEFMKRQLPLPFTE
jgi:hypothetical protein